MSEHEFFHEGNYVPIFEILSYFSEPHEQAVVKRVCKLFNAVMKKVPFCIDVFMKYVVRDYTSREFLYLERISLFPVRFLFECSHFCIFRFRHVQCIDFDYTKEYVLFIKVIKGENRDEIECHRSIIFRYSEEAHNIRNANKNNRIGLYEVNFNRLLKYKSLLPIRGTSKNGIITVD